MMPSSTATPRRWLLAALLGAVLMPAVHAQEGKTDVASLKDVPADAAYYGATLRAKEQIDIVAKSKAWKKFIGLPGIQLAWQAAGIRVKSQYDEFIKDPENAWFVDLQLDMDLLLDMVSSEVYSYGGANSTDVAQFITEVYSAYQYGPFMIELTGNPKDLNQQQMQRASVLAAMVRNIDLIKAPDLVVGFKLSKKDAAEAQLKRLEKVLLKAAEDEEELKGSVKRVKVAGVEFVTLNLEGKMLHPENYLAPFKDYETKKGDYDALLKKLNNLKVTVGLGIRDGYLLLAAGESLAHLEKLGKGPGLNTRPELKPLANFAGQRITSVGYVSKELNGKVSPNKRDVQIYLSAADAWLPEAKLTPEQEARFKKDLVAFTKEVEKHLPQAGAVLSFGFMSDRGTERYVHDWSKNPDTDGSKPLTLLNHLGGDPLVAAVGRGRSSPNVMKALQPLLKRLDEATGQFLVPALADGQAGFVLDAKLTSKQWFPLMPESSRPLPMLEPAVIVGVSDPKALVKAFGEYRGIANDLGKEMQNLFKEEGGISPELQEKLGPDLINFLKSINVPEPKVSEIKGGTMYAYPLPQHLGVEKLLPNAFVGTKLAGATISEEHSVRLLTETPLKTDGGPLADTKKNLAAASYINWSGMVDTLAPWVEYGFDLAPAGGLFDKDDILKQVKGAFASLKAFRTTTSATYLEGGATITHSETIIRDLP
jgi:hypothetical protein